MSIASIMVSLDLGEAASTRVRVAASLAERFQATLTGIAAGKVAVPALFGDIAVEQSVYDEDNARLCAELASAKAVFERGADRAPRTGWRQADALPEAFLVSQARGADLIIVGRGPGGGVADRFAAAPDAVLMQAGRPILLVPPDVARLKAARIVVAWKDCMEARRAVTAALPFVDSADQVFVVSGGSDARLQGAEDVAELLARHGAHVTTHLINAATGDIADEILRFANHQDADLIVMGGYGHSQLRERLLGGMTRDMLRRSPLCCLMAH